MLTSTFIRPICLAAALCCFAGAQAATSYRITDLSPPIGLGKDINNLGQVVGTQGVWDATNGVQVLGPLRGGGAFGINDLGQVVGHSAVNLGEGEVIQVFVWSASAGLQGLATPQAPNYGGYTYSYATAINNLGQVVGYSSSPAGERAFVANTDGSGALSLASPGSQPGTVGGTRAHDINDLGQVVGGTSTSDSYRAFMWSADAGMLALGDLSGGADYSEALGINNLGQVVGHSVATTGMRAFLWSASEGMLDLGVLAGVGTSEAFDINSLGQVVGYSSAGGGSSTAFVWTSSEGMQDLNGLIAQDDPLKGSVHLAEATAINDAGQIVGSGFLNGSYHTFLLTAVPEPHALLLILAGGIAAFQCRPRCRS